MPFIMKGCGVELTASYPIFLLQAHELISDVAAFQLQVVVGNERHLKVDICGTIVKAKGFGSVFAIPFPITELWEIY